MSWRALEVPKIAEPIVFEDGGITVVSLAGVANAGRALATVGDCWRARPPQRTPAGHGFAERALIETQHVAADSGDVTQTYGSQVTFAEGLPEYQQAADTSRGLSYRELGLKRGASYTVMVGYRGDLTHPMPAQRNDSLRQGGRLGLHVNTDAFIYQDTGADHSPPAPAGQPFEGKEGVVINPILATARTAPCWDPDGSYVYAAWGDALPKASPVYGLYQLGVGIAGTPPRAVTDSDGDWGPTLFWSIVVPSTDRYDTDLLYFRGYMVDDAGTVDGLDGRILLDCAYFIPYLDEGSAGLGDSATLSFLYGGQAAAAFATQTDQADGVNQRWNTMLRSEFVPAWAGLNQLGSSVVTDYEVLTEQDKNDDGIDTPGERPTLTRVTGEGYALIRKGWASAYSDALNLTDAGSDPCSVTETIHILKSQTSDRFLADLLAAPSGQKLTVGGNFLGSPANTQFGFEVLQVVSVGAYDHSTDSYPVVVRRGMSNTTQPATSNTPTTRFYSWGVSIDPEPTLAIANVGAPGYATRGSRFGIPFDEQLAFVPDPNRGRFAAPDPVGLPLPQPTESYVIDDISGQTSEPQDTRLAVIARGLGARTKLAMIRHPRATIWSFTGGDGSPVTGWGYQPLDAATPAEVLEFPGDHDYMDFYLCQSWGIYLNDQHVEFPPSGTTPQGELGFVDGPRVDETAGLSTESLSICCYVDASQPASTPVTAVAAGLVAEQLEPDRSENTEGVYLDGFHFLRQGYVRFPTDDTVYPGDGGVDESEDTFISYDAVWGVLGDEWS